MQKKFRIKYFPLYVDDLFEDDRVIQLTMKEQQQWLFLLAKMWRQKAAIPDEVNTLASLIGCTKNEAINFRAKLLTLRLLTIADNKLVSPRLLEEYTKAHSIYVARSEAGVKGADARWKETP